MKRKNVFIATILAFIIIIQGSLSVIQVNAVEPSGSDNPAIIDDDVFSSKVYDNGKYLVCLRRDAIPDSVIENKLISDYGYSTEVYENE